MMRMNMKTINKAEAHSGNPSFFTLLRSYAALGITNSTHLEKLIQTGCKSGTLKLDEALSFFQSLIHSRPMPSDWAFNQLIGTLSKMNHHSTVVSMIRQMRAVVDLDPQVSAMNIVIKCYCRLNKADLGFSVLAITRKCGLQSNANTIDKLLNGLCRDKESMEDAVE
ncbi:hypothetical protein FNV43_RR01253 [Rhamnella rubrinervis]|uniref:Pentatricopeptide repeat-containing protein n=1 Tax=Rhamnella rubrinervis TaxID=2594499 RepID=A0A8K0HS82_9ROSA|nr:hypothetical protein FNV43_RR01253 [Rhamnella rubrinervis]